MSNVMPITPTLTIDEDKECPQCGKPGSVNNGLCLKCGVKKLERMANVKIGPITIAEIERTINSLLVLHATDIDVAFILSDDEKPMLSIALTVKLEPGKTGIDIDTTMTFVKDRVKDKVSSHADENQKNLFDAKDKP